MNKLCENCIHKPICGEKDKYEQYCNEMKQLSNKYDIFEQAPKCQYYKEDIKVAVRNIIDNNINIKKEEKKQLTTLDLYEKAKDIPNIPESMLDILKNGEPEPFKDEEEFNEILDILKMLRLQFESLNEFQTDILNMFILNEYNRFEKNFDKRKQ